ncbi:MAG: uncharacterized protein A8A55_1518 [Amphiamblys sp. WSBS2006]|nr:MAG: uncharacterized protein A8A55_1518 [Amphiamblys sp. WSBS2006]
MNEKKIDGSIGIVIDGETKLCKVGRHFVFLHGMAEKVAAGEEVHGEGFHRMAFGTNSFYLYCPEHTKGRSKEDAPGMPFEEALFVQRNRKNIFGLLDGLGVGKQIQTEQFLRLLIDCVSCLGPEHRHSSLPETPPTDIFDAAYVFTKQCNQLCPALFPFGGMVASVNIGSVAELREAARNKNQATETAVVEKEDLLGTTTFCIGYVTADESGNLLLVDSTDSIPVSFIDSTGTVDSLVVAAVHGAIVEKTRLDSTAIEKTVLLLAQCRPLLRRKKSLEDSLLVEITNVFSPTICIDSALSATLVCLGRWDGKKCVLKIKHSALFPHARPSTVARLTNLTDITKDGDVKVFITTDETEMQTEETIPEDIPPISAVARRGDERTAFVAVLCGKIFIKTKTPSHFLGAKENGKTLAGALFERYSLATPFWDRMAVYVLKDTGKTHEESFRLYWETQNTVLPIDAVALKNGYKVFVKIHNIQKRTSGNGTVYFVGDSSSFVESFVATDRNGEARRASLSSTAPPCLTGGVFAFQVGLVTDPSCFILRGWVGRIQSLAVETICSACEERVRRERCPCVFSQKTEETRVAYSFLFQDETGSVAVECSSVDVLKTLFGDNGDKKLSVLLYEAGAGTLGENGGEIATEFLGSEKKRFSFMCKRTHTDTPLSKKHHPKYSPESRSVVCFEAERVVLRKEIFRVLKMFK